MGENGGYHLWTFTIKNIVVDEMGGIFKSLQVYWSCVERLLCEIIL